MDKVLKKTLTINFFSDLFKKFFRTKYPFLFITFFNESIILYNNNINNNYSVQLLNGKAYFLILLSIDISSCFFNTLQAKKIPCDKWLNQLNFKHEEN